ncbi:MAG: SDR family NAD(P)-dependent oxidoreductase, partial [Methyloceanibacter sp.]
MLNLTPRASKAEAGASGTSAKRFGDQVVLVTGGASGIGQDLCALFARRGARIGLIDRDKAKLESFGETLRQSGVTCATAAADVRERERLHGAVRQIAAALGPIDILIASAGICRASTVDDLRISHLEEIVQVNFLGMV